MNWMTWYDRLSKPSWTPAPSTIRLIWQILYPIILVSIVFVFVQAARKKLDWLVALPFGVNPVTNLVFTPILFGLQHLPLASIDILAWIPMRGLRLNKMTKSPVIHPLNPRGSLRKGVSESLH